LIESDERIHDIDYESNNVPRGHDWYEDDEDSIRLI
jgi:hypothetical protein